MATATAAKTTKNTSKTRPIADAQFAEDAIVTVLVANPKRPGTSSHTRFAAYGKEGTKLTVAQALAKGVLRADLAWDQEHGFISIGKGKSKTASG